MKRYPWLKTCGVIAAALTLTTVLALAGANPNPGVAPIGSNAGGNAYNEWSAAWWQWAASVPASDNPLFDETGDKVAAGQSGHVWFLCGVFNVTGTATRTCTIPAGKALFFPILNYTWISTPGDPAWDQPYTDPATGITYPTFEAFQRHDLAAKMDSVTGLACEIDGVPVRDLASYRVQSVVFDVTLPVDNIFGIDAGTYGPSVDDGYYLLLSPLSAGQHTIHFQGTVPGAPDFTLDITYHLTVNK